MSKVFLGLGSNLGDTESNLLHAISEIELRIGRIISRSAFHITRPWGFESDHLFCNAVVCAETGLDAFALLGVTQDIERSLGRLEKSTREGYVDRIVDIDILALDDVVLSSVDLTLPHPFMHQRRFVLQPLREIAPDWVHPQLNKSISELFQELNDYE